jgi:hypothetical protein
VPGCHIFRFKIEPVGIGAYVRVRTHMIELVKQMAEDIRWLRQRQETRDRLERRSDEELLKLIEQTHRGPKKKAPGSL